MAIATSPDTIWTTELGSLEPAVTSFIERAIQGTGELIPIPGQTSIVGEPLFVSVRIIGPQLSSAYQADNFIAVDVFAQRGDEIVPIGYRDIAVYGETAFSDKNLHALFTPHTVEHERARYRWSTMDATKVDHIKTDIYAYEIARDPSLFDRLREQGLGDELFKELYRRRGIGTFMTTVTLCVLRSRGVKSINVKTLNDEAKGVWRKFGDPDSGDMSVEELISNPNFLESLRKFLKAPE